MARLVPSRAMRAAVRGHGASASKARPERRARQAEHPRQWEAAPPAAETRTRIPPASNPGPCLPGGLRSDTTIARLTDAAARRPPARQCALGATAIPGEPGAVSAVASCHRTMSLARSPRRFRSSGSARCRYQPLGARRRGESSARDIGRVAPAMVGSVADRTDLGDALAQRLLDALLQRDVGHPATLAAAAEAQGHHAVIGD